MGAMKELLLQGYSTGVIWTIGDTEHQNPFVGKQVKVTWLKPWGGRETGFQVTGELLATFCVNGRTLIGEIGIEGHYGKKKISCPWSKRWISVEVLSDPPAIPVHREPIFQKEFYDE